ncbi:phytanoyl-CoA dioxygenase family protein [Agaribacter flavus]|uniref:Phytanoyl-CoA dioxygenase family protein n=1 Tax=Agaribacter flavus TaxID=1902781 RepID=A0ABV7FIG2_9ALTE
MLNQQQLLDYKKNGFLVLADFFSEEEMHAIQAAANQVVEDFDPSQSRAIFSTKDHEKTRNDYFLGSSDKVRCFFEEEAFDEHGNLRQEKSLSINKIGHALHILHPVFKAFSHSSKIKLLARNLGIQAPSIRQSMYIFKQPKIGGVIRWHQDATYFYTHPISVVTFWVAVEDANIENGCLQVQAQAPKTADANSAVFFDSPLREQFMRFADDSTELKVLDCTPWPADESAMPLEVKKGTLVAFNGLLPHFSAPNTSEKSRHAYTLHITCDDTEYVKENWIQSPGSRLY